MKLPIVLLTLSLTGCGQYMAITRSAAVEGASAADELKTSSEFMLCNAITVGAWMRAYGDNPKKAEAWRVLCSAPSQETPG